MRTVGHGIAAGVDVEGVLGASAWKVVGPSTLMAGLTVMASTVRLASDPRKA